MPLTQTQLDQLLMTLGSHLRDRELSPIQVAEYITESGLDNEELARLSLLKGPSMIAKFRSLANLKPSILALVDWGRSNQFIGASVAFELSRLDTTIQEKIYKRCIEYRMTKEEMIELRQRLDLGESLENAMDSVIDGRPKIIRYYVSIGAITDSTLSNHLKKLTAMERNLAIEKVLASQCTVSSQWGARLTSERFTLSGEQDFADYVDTLPGGSEECITKLLKKELLP